MSAEPSLPHDPNLETWFATHWEPSPWQEGFLSEIPHHTPQDFPNWRNQQTFYVWLLYSIPDDPVTVFHKVDLGNATMVIKGSHPEYDLINQHAQTPKHA
jgi:hypothetical protein